MESRGVYVQEVDLWGKLHYIIDHHNPYKISTAARGSVLRANPFGRARDLVQNVRAEIMAAEVSVPIIIELLHKRDSLRMTSFIFGELKSLLSCRRSTSETHIAFEARFASQLSKFNSIDSTSALPGCMAAYYLLDPANFDEAQVTSIMDAASPKDSSSPLDSQMDPS